MDPARADTRDFGSDGNAQKNAEWRDPRISAKWRGQDQNGAETAVWGGIFENYIFCCRYSRLAP
jgi:hypothetical protein